MQTLCSRAETSLNECEVISQDVGVQVRKKIGVLSLVVPEIRPPLHDGKARSLGPPSALSAAVGHTQMDTLAGVFLSEQSSK